MASGCVREKQWPVWAVWHGPGLSGALEPRVGRPLAPQGTVGALLKVAEGPGKSGGPRCLPVAGGYFRTGVFFFLRPLPFMEKGTTVCMFADHLLCAPPVQLSLQEAVIACHRIKPL